MGSPKTRTISIALAIGDVHKDLRKALLECTSPCTPGEENAGHDGSKVPLMAHLLFLDFATTTGALIETKISTHNDHLRHHNVIVIPKLNMHAAFGSPESMQRPGIISIAHNHSLTKSVPTEDNWIRGMRHRAGQGRAFVLCRKALRENVDESKRQRFEQIIGAMEESRHQPAQIPNKSTR